MLSNAYMTKRQREIWGLRLKGLSGAEIGRRLGISRQAIYDADAILSQKIENALRDAADASMTETLHIDSEKAILLGYQPATDERVIITFSISNGIQTWRYNRNDCGVCSWTEKCLEKLGKEASERNISLSKEDLNKPPSRLAHLIFSKVIPGLPP